MNTKSNEEYLDELDTDFTFLSLEYKGQRHWKDGVKRSLVANWLKKVLEAKDKEKEEAVWEVFAKLLKLSTESKSNREFGRAVMGYIILTIPLPESDKTE